jgi:UDP-glucose:(heptosyl)LPS alpha-1,3-glucosyltransferase
MRIALVFSGCHPRGGVERVAWEAANHLADRHDVTVVTAVADPLPPKVSVDLVEPRAGGPLEPLRFRAAAARALDHRAFDLTVSFGSNCPPGDVLVVQSVHRSWVERGTAVSVGPVSVPGAARRVMPRHLVRLRAESQWFKRSPTATVVAVSENVSEDVQHYYGVAPSAVRVIPNGFDPAQCSDARRHELRPEMRDRLGIRGEEIALLLIANEWHRKGLGVVLRAMDRIGDPRVRLLLVGRQAPTAYEGLIQQLGLQDRVQWCGIASDVAEYHAAADLFVMPTAYEAFGSVIVEALGSGLPVITSASAGAAIAVREDGNGLLQRDPTDPDELTVLLGCALAPGVLDRWSAAAAYSVVDYTWSRVMERFEAALVEHAARRVASEPGSE